VAQQLVASTKWKARGASKVGSQAYWKERIEGASGPRYTEYWTHISYYELERIQALAEVDYRVLGREEPGAPDHRDNLGEEPPIYPTQVLCKPHWWKGVHSICWKDFRIWAWFSAVKALESPIGQEANTWHNYLDRHQTRLEGVDILGRFKKECKVPDKDLPYQVQFDLNSVPPQTKYINTIQFEIPTGYPFGTLNDTLEDLRPRPVTEEGTPIRKEYLKWYLQERLREYLALGGTKELVEREELILNSDLPRAFYWDLWADIETVRLRYNFYCADNFIDPESLSEDDQESIGTAGSFDTQ
jgi:hypothetical protein